MAYLLAQVIHLPVILVLNTDFNIRRYVISVSNKFLTWDLASRQTLLNFLNYLLNCSKKQFFIDNFCKNLMFFI